MKTTKPEILAPAGTYEAMEAAVKAGCDAVYAGGSLFSARAFAGNFDEASFLKAIDFCHLYGVKVYMTINTLLKDPELDGDGLLSGEHLVSYLKPYYLAGLDAVLVQDMGVLRVLREHFPLLPVHASTQMSISSAYGARIMKELGLERIVPARELSLEEIRSIRKQVPVEIETFVHGAMCFAYSGKCLLSSFAGGRSGNRGRCAQPCRKCYELYDAGESEGGPSVRGYLLSLKDICTLEELPLLIDAGIDSFKIEGRMKNPSYVASTVSAYREARDLYLEMKDREQAARFEALSEKSQQAYLKTAVNLKERMMDVYNRGGFHSGYYFTDKGKEMSALERPNHQGLLVGTVTAVKAPKIAVKLTKDLHRQDVIELRKKGGDIELTSGEEGKAGTELRLNAKDLKKIRPGMEVFRTRNAQLLSEIEKEILQTEKTIPVSCLICAKTGTPLRLTLQAEGCGKTGEDVSITLEGELVEEAKGAPTSEEVLKEKMKKSGGSGIGIRQIRCETDPDSFVRMSAFNALRREAAQALKEQIVKTYRREPETIL